ncbi:hypothetical protein HYH02_014162 [Chlamydomonas schloesseri]|uniref:Uncharacterized protein n=1 Tax=Chlamydomonas schloesseri TaxID=2026947 RepID=A0A835SZ81_9CHLO|nr:hypothetical protein HYH02_014162 [Chlamydomonas schloesseri]|eukprot:KAG2429125.1 hypothetical protein HYH02_014162 [Chlamydomonas schloesseri]
MAAYGRSLADAARDVPTESELCGFTWNLAFKFIPWFSAALGSLTVRRYFQTNHTLTAPPADPLWGDSEPQRHYWYFRAAAPDAAAAAAAAAADMDGADEGGEGGAPNAAAADAAIGPQPAPPPPPRPLTLLQVNTYPALTCRRTPDWGWELQNAMVRLTIDAAAGPNPGLPPGHPAARETMTLEQIRARFDALLALQDLEDSSEDEEEQEEHGEDSSSRSSSSRSEEEDEEEEESGPAEESEEYGVEEGLEDDEDE